MTKPVAIGIGQPVLISGPDYEWDCLFDGQGGLICDMAEAEADPSKPELWAVYVFAEAEVRVFPPSALRPCTLEEAQAHA